MRWLTVTLVALICVLQWPLWLGKGSWLRVWQLEKDLKQQHQITQKMVSRNAALDAEVRDLKKGIDAVEELARNELGMIKEGEVFFQIVDINKPKPKVSTTQTNATE